MGLESITVLTFLVVRIALVFLNVLTYYTSYIARYLMPRLILNRTRDT